MHRIRFHGRGGQGIKTAGRILGSAFFLEGYEVQDAPVYGAERRGAPVFAYVRADRAPIFERGIIVRPDLVLVADDSLAGVPAAGVLNGVTGGTVLLFVSATGAETWRARLGVSGPVLTLPPVDREHAAGPLCAGAAARLAGAIGAGALERAVRDELGGMDGGAAGDAVRAALDGYAAAGSFSVVATPQPVASAAGYAAPDWIDVPLESADVAAPAIHAPLTSLAARTGLWRTLRPVIDYAHCNRCWWVCSEFCPDGAIAVESDGTPRIDYDHCKGCMICVTQCPPHAIAAVPEQQRAAQ